MAYLVLARKYRPQAFADVTGQEHVVQTLSNALRSGRVAHAMLLCGPRGCGKTTSARIIAKALNCEKGPTPDPCGVCTPCREITAGTDVDVQEIDAASNTGVDNVRELRESAKYLPARDRFKIFIVDEVHMLSKAAFNAFLKTLEEPPGHVKFLFATTDPQALPDTILSRCQRHNFRLVPLKQIVERIRFISHAENVTIDDGAVALVARQAAGSMRDALSILDQLFSSCGAGVPITAADAAQALGALDRTVISDLAAALLARDSKGVLQGVARAYDGGHDLKRLTEDLATHLRNMLAASVAGAPLDLPDHELRTLREQAAAAEPAELARLFELVHGALFEISRAAQPRHALEIALLRAIFLAPAASVQSLLSRADELARRLGGTGGPPPSGGGGGPRPRASFEAAPAQPAAHAPAFHAASSLPAHATASAEPRGARDYAAAPAVAAEAPAPVVAEAPRVPVEAHPAAPAFAPVAEPARPAPSFVATPATARASVTAPAFAPAPPPATPAAATPAAATPAARPGPDSRPPWERHLSLVPAPEPRSPALVAEPGDPAARAEPVAAPGAPAPTPLEAPLAPSSVPSAGTAAGDPVATAAPSPAPAAHAVPPVSPEAALAQAKWPAAVEAVRAKRKVLASWLDHGRPLALSGGELSLGYVRGEMYAQNVSTDRVQLESLLSEAFGAPIRLRIVELSVQEGSRTESLAESQDRADREARDARLRVGREHPGVVRAAAILAAEIEEVRDLGGVST